MVQSECRCWCPPRDFWRHGCGGKKCKGKIWSAGLKTIEHQQGGGRAFFSLSIPLSTYFSLSLSCAMTTAGIAPARMPNRNCVCVSVSCFNWSVSCSNPSRGNTAGKTDRILPSCPRATSTIDADQNSPVGGMWTAGKRPRESDREAASGFSCFRARRPSHVFGWGPAVYTTYSQNNSTEPPFMKWNVMLSSMRARPGLASTAHISARDSGGV